MANQKEGAKDELTGLLRGDIFIEASKKEIAEAEKQERVVSMAFVDLDFFGKINVEHGMEAGDEVLRLASGAVAGAFPKGSIFRCGGDEFAILLPEVEKEQAFLRLEQCRVGFDKKHEISSKKQKIGIALSFSAGIASYPHDAVRVEEIMRKAADALHRAKTTGGNKICIAREERMVTKTSHYTPGQLERLTHLAKKVGVGEAALLREALDDLLMKYAIIR